MNESFLTYERKLKMNDLGLLAEIEERQENAIIDRLLNKSKKMKMAGKDPIQSQVYLDWEKNEIKKKRRVNTEISVDKKIDLNKLREIRARERNRSNADQSKDSSEDISIQRRHYSQSVQLPKLSKNFNRMNNNEQSMVLPLTSNHKKNRTAMHSKLNTIEDQEKEEVAKTEKTKNNKKSNRKLKIKDPRIENMNTKYRSMSRINTKKGPSSPPKEANKIKVMKMKLNPSTTKAKIVNKKQKPILFKKQWLEVDILQMNTFFVKMKSKRREGNQGENIPVSQIKENNFGEWSFPRSKERVADFIRKYKPKNPQMSIDELIRSPYFSVIYDDQSSQPSLYFGELKDNKKFGSGIFVNTNIRFEGTWVNDQKLAGYQTTHQGYFIGKFKKNKRHGEGQFFWNNHQYYSGQWYAGFKNGTGMWKAANGDSYFGHWAHGKVQGEGVHLTHTGQRYEGPFQNFLKQGKGKQSFPNGDVFEGKYKNGKPNGFGKYTWKNGVYYVGDFVDGYRHGKGSIIAKDYLNFTGNFERDTPNGFGELTYANGNEYRGNFKDGMKEGKGILNLKNEKKIMQGYWKKNQLIGQQGEQDEQIQ